MNWCIVLLWALFGTWGINHINTSEELAAETLERERAAVAEHVRGVFQLADSFIGQADLWIKQNPERDPRTDPQFLKMVQDFQRVTGPSMLIRLVQTDGSLSLIPPEPGAKPANIADRDYFKAAQKAPAGEIQISRPFQGRSTGKWAISLATRLSHPVHNINTLFIAIELNYFDRAFEKFRIPERGSISIFRRDGILLARSSTQPVELGSDLSQSALFNLALRYKDNGTLQMDSVGMNKTRRLVAYGTVDNYPLVVTLSDSLEAIRQTPQRNILMIGTLLAIITLLAIYGQRRAARLLQHLAKHRLQMTALAREDALTGIMNRRRLLELGTMSSRRAQRYREPLSLIMTDLDFFKRINDQHGHPAGDAVLQAFTKLVQRCLRETDHFGRIGGEEFAIILPMTDLKGALQLAERIRHTVATTPLLWQNTYIETTASFGVTVLQENETEFDPLYSRADRALYRAKQAGRNRAELD